MSVLVAIGDDSLSGQVLDVAVRLGNALDQELYIVHLTERAQARGEEREIRDELQSELEGRAVEFSVAIEYVNHDRGRSSRTIGNQIAEIAADTTISQVVIGHRSKALFERLREGNTAFTVANTANVPVTVVPENLADTVPF